MTDATRPDPARATGILGRILLLGLFVALVAGIVQRFLVAPVDGAARQREYFGEAPPAGLALDSAGRLPTGEAVVRFLGSAESWAASEVLFFEYQSPAAAEAEMRTDAKFGVEAAQRLKEWEAEKAFAWTALQKRDEIAWGNWRAKLVIERFFRAGGGWNDEARVDLSTPARPLVLCVRWPAETAADERELRALLERIQLAPAG
jgi:hypothetical protein